MWFKRQPQARPGDAAPPFTLTAHTGRSVSLVDFRGQHRVLLVFHPADETLSALEAHKRRFRALKAQIVAVSPNDTATQARLVSKHKLSFPVLSDPEGAVARVYGAVGVLPFSASKAVVVDGHGVLRLAMAGRPDMERLLAFLSGLHGDLPRA